MEKIAVGICDDLPVAVCQMQNNGGSFTLYGDGKEAVAELILPCK